MATPENDWEHFLLGGNPDSKDGYWGTREEAAMAFCYQLESALRSSQYQVRRLFLRARPQMRTKESFEGGTRWAFTFRFALEKTLEDTNGNT